LKLISAAGTVFIAACYGVPYEFTRGRVIDAGTQAGIAGIEVDCLGETGTSIEVATSDAWGDFQMSVACAELALSDVDGAANGAYAAKTIAVTTNYVLVDLEPLP
jgi:hypothetical protein